MMNYELQRYKLTKYLNKKGIDSDKVDLYARIDRKLTFNENKRLISKHVGLSDNSIRGRVSGYELSEKAREYNEFRKKHSRSTDYNLRAKNTFYPDSLTKKQFGKWKKNPNKYDIEGVDTRGGY